MATTHTCAICGIPADAARGAFRSWEIDGETFEYCPGCRKLIVGYVKWLMVAGKPKRAPRWVRILLKIGVG